MIRAALAALIMLMGCGGGGSSSEPAVTTPLRTDLLFGYWQPCDALEFSDHTNVCIVGSYLTGEAWFGEVLPQLEHARVGALRVVLALPGGYGNWTVIDLVTIRERTAPFADLIVAIYPQDEPDKRGFPDSYVVQQNEMVRSVFIARPLAVFFGDTGRFPGIGSFDWVGQDRYGAGCDQANGSGYRNMKVRLSQSQRLLLIAGGSDPWRQDPGCFARAAHSDAQVVGLLAFAWRDNVDAGVGRGVRSNGLRSSYCRVGREVIGGRVETC